MAIHIKITTVGEAPEGVRAFVKNLPGAFTRDGETLHSGRNAVKAFTEGGTRFVVKRYKRPNLIQSVAYTFFKKSKAERAYLYASRLRGLGFSTPRELAFAEVKTGGLLSDSYFVSAECTLPSVAGSLAGPDFDRTAADAVAELVVSLHSKGVLHGDLNLSNILYSREGRGYAFTLIDTNRSVFKRPTRRECTDNMKRLTHDRHLLAYIASRYAMMRGWDKDGTVAAVMRSLDRFECRRALIGRMKRLVRGGRYDGATTGTPT